MHRVRNIMKKSLTSSGKRNLNYGQSSESLNLIDSTIQSIMSSRYHAISLSKSYKMYTSNSRCFKSLTKGHRPTKTMGGKEIREYLKSHHSDSKTSTAIEMILLFHETLYIHSQNDLYASLTFLITWENKISYFVDVLLIFYIQFFLKSGYEWNCKKMVRCTCD